MYKRQSYDLNCAEFNWDDEACCAANGLGQSTDPNALCYEDPNVSLADQCAASGGFYCGDDTSNWTSYSPYGCVPASYVCANDGSDCVDGSDEAPISQGGSSPEPTCLDTTCGIYITYYGYTCSEMISYGYDCSF